MINFERNDKGNDELQIFMGWRGVVSYRGDGTVSHITWTQGPHGGVVPLGMFAGNGVRRVRADRRAPQVLLSSCAWLCMSTK